MVFTRINNNDPDIKIINQAVEVLRRGGVLVIPTETAYGLAADASNKKAVKKIYRIKGRSFKKFLPLIAGSNWQIRKYFKVNKKELELFRKYKELSVVLGVKSEKIYSLPSQDTCAVRVTTNKVASLLAKKLGAPITATSANKTGRGNCYSVEDLLKQIKESQVDMIIDGGKLRKKKPSTIVEVTDTGVSILRQGEIKILNFKF